LEITGEIMTVFERLQDVASQVFGAKLEEVTLESNLIDDLGADSLDWAEMVIETEEEFNITIDEDEFKKLYTIGDIINYLKENGIEDK